MQIHKMIGSLAGIIKILRARPRVPTSLAANPLLRTILSRRSVRRFTGDDLEPDAWAAILEAGRMAPSTVNLQTWSFVTFSRDRWREFFGKPLPFGAARAVMVLADVHRARRVVDGFPYAPLCEYTVGVMNASLSAMNMALAAEAVGVSSVMLSETGKTGFYDARFLAAELALPPGVVPLVTVVFGIRRGGRPAMPPKLPIEAVVFSGKYRETERPVLAQWYRQMQAGYRATHGGKGFASQVEYYNRRIEEAEKELQDLVFYAGEP